MIKNLSIVLKWMFGYKVSNRDVSNDYPTGGYTTIGVRLLSLR